MGAFLNNSFCTVPDIVINDQWLRLLQYEETSPHQYRSRAEGKGFFASENGRFDPQLELNTFVERLNEKNGDEGHVLCRFPARAFWLKKYYPSQKIPSVSCKRWEGYKSRIAGNSAAVVFSSYYMGNPGSSFGHTFLRIGKKGLGDNVSLLDTGVSYGAMADGADPFSYVVGGLGGWFHGSVIAIPYYYKVREYNDYEMRDLWNYHLKLNLDQIELLVAHTWELEEAYFRYYFLSENCSLVIIRMIEAVSLELNLEKELPFYTIPSDTLKVLMKSGIVEHISYRPSAWADFQWHHSHLTGKEKREFDLLLKDGSHELKGPDLENIHVLDTMLRHVDFTHAKELLKESPEALAYKRPFLLKRASIQIPSEEPKYHIEKGPHLGHASKRLTLGSHFYSGQTRPLVEFRFALHDLLDSSGGYPERSTLEVMKIGVEAKDEQKMFLRELTLLRATTLQPLRSYYFPPSWSFSLGFDRFHSLNSYNWKTLKLNTALGLTFGPQKNIFSISAMANVEALYAFEDANQFILAYGPQIIGLFNFTENLKLMVLGTYHFHPWIDRSIASGIRWGRNQWAIDGSYETHSGQFGNRLTTKFHFYY